MTQKTLSRPKDRPAASAAYKLRKIAQAHLAPGMSLSTWQAIIFEYVPPDCQNLDFLTPAQADEIIQRISAIVHANKPINN